MICAVLGLLAGSVAGVALEALAQESRPDPQPPAQRAAGAPAPAAVLARRPGELPRAEPGTWSRFYGAERGSMPGLETLDPAHRASVERAEQAYSEGDYPSALEELFDVLERAPDLPPAWLVLGTTYFRLRRYEDSIHAYRRLLEVAPGELWRTQALGHGLYSLGDYAEARAHYAAVLEVLPESREARRGLALSHMRLGDEAEALRLLAKTLESDAADFEALYWTARILFENDRAGEALGFAERASAVDPFDPRPWYLLTQVLYELGEDTQARSTEERWRALDRTVQELRVVEALLRTEPHRFDLWGRRVELHRSIGHLEEVRRGLERLFRVRPSDVDPFGLFGWAMDLLVELGDAEGARAVAAMLEEALPEDPRTWEKLQGFYAHQRDRLGQLRAARRASELAEREERAASEPGGDA